MKDALNWLKEKIIYHSELKAAIENDLKAGDSFILNKRERKAIPNVVNLHRWIRYDGAENIGDYLSKVIVDYMLKRNDINAQKRLRKTRHLYAAGSILSLGLQNATVWGSGYLRDITTAPVNNVYDKVNYRLMKMRKLDIRCVRGPETRRVLMSLGFKCPEIYGDPAVLMPLIYKPDAIKKTKKFSVVRHWSDNSAADNIIPILTTDYKGFINNILSSERIISSSLHGIILAEAYGVPAVLYIPPECKDRLDEFKYRDYYYSTGRYEFPIARSVKGAFDTKPCALPDLTRLQDNLLKTFPYDLWGE